MCVSEWDHCFQTGNSLNCSVCRWHWAHSVLTCSSYTWSRWGNAASNSRTQFTGWSRRLCLDETADNRSACCLVSFSGCSGLQWSCYHISVVRVRVSPGTSEEIQTSCVQTDSWLVMQSRLDGSLTANQSVTTTSHEGWRQVRLTHLTESLLSQFNLFIFTKHF